jgi:hypothetical protein
MDPLTRGVPVPRSCREHGRRGRDPRAKDTIHIRDELMLEAHPEGPYILLRREGEPGSVRVYLKEVRYLADAVCAMAAQTAGLAAGDDESGDG